jgi:hypothetical protein
VLKRAFNSWVQILLKYSENTQEMEDLEVKDQVVKDLEVKDQNTSQREENIQALQSPSSSSSRSCGV